MKEYQTPLATIVYFQDEIVRTSDNIGGIPIGEENIWGI